MWIYMYLFDLPKEVTRISTVQVTIMNKYSFIILTIQKTYKCCSDHQHYATFTCHLYDIEITNIGIIFEYRNVKRPLIDSCACHFICVAFSVFDACVFEPCEYNGTCLNGTTNFTCLCVAGYTGETCQTGMSLKHRSPQAGKIRNLDYVLDTPRLLSDGCIKYL